MICGHLGQYEFRAHSTQLAAPSVPWDLQIRRKRSFQCVRLVKDPASVRHFEEALIGDTTQLVGVRVYSMRVF